MGGTEGHTGKYTRTHTHMDKQCHSFPEPVDDSLSLPKDGRRAEPSFLQQTWSSWVKKWDTVARCEAGEKNLVAKVMKNILCF